MSLIRGERFKPHGEDVCPHACRRNENEDETIAPSPQYKNKPL